MGSGIKINGYEYFIYTSGEQSALPEGVELGKWYRREAKIKRFKYAGRFVGYIYDENGEIEESFFKCIVDVGTDYSAPEPVPEYLFKK